MAHYRLSHYTDLHQFNGNPESLTSLDTDYMSKKIQRRINLQNNFTFIYQFMLYKYDGKMHDNGIQQKYLRGLPP